jgi:PAS domain S-box-containing protein
MLEGLKPHDHLCLIYESREEWRAIVVPFIAVGLRLGEKCIYILDTHSADEIRRYLTEEGINVTAAEQTGQLSILHQTETYTRGGSFDPDRMIAMLIAKTEMAVAEGYPALRITGEMTWMLHSHPGSEKLLEYEAKLNKDLFPKYPCLAICQYDRWKFDPELIKGIVMTHPLLVRDNRIYRNFYYIPTDEFLNAKRAELEAQHWLNNLEREERVQTALRESEEFNVILLENSPNPVLVINPDSSIRYVSPSMERLTGYTAAELIGRKDPHPWWLEGRGQQTITDLQERLAGGHVTEEALYQKKNGELFWVNSNAVLVKKDGEKLLVLVNWTDITERKRAEEALQNSETQLSDTMKIAKIGYWEFDLAEGLFIFNDQFYSIFHTSADQVGGYKMSPDRYAELFLPPDDRSQVLDGTKQVLETADLHSSYQVDHRIIYADGGIGYISVRSFAVRDSEGRIIRVYGANQDITDRKLAEEKHRTILETALDGFWLCDLEGRFLEVNESYCKMIGYTKDELLKMSIRDVEAVENPEETIRRIKEIEEQGHDHFQSRHKPKDGNIIDVEVSVNYLHVAEGQMSVFIRDITERKKLEEEQQKIAKLESIGTLAGGIAHDFNNILTGIMGNISLAQRLVEPSDMEIAERLEDAKKASIRARDLTHRLLTFARGGAPIKKTISIAGVMRESATFALRGSNVRCKYSLPDDLLSVEADEGQLNQVFTNLVINAAEAMPKGGTLNITARNQAIKETGTLPLPKGNYVEITVVDDGTGISKAHLESIFDPYFTTKQRGSGLGLATTYSIIKNHDGYITVESELGVGTTFYIYLPASKKPAQVKAEVSREIPITGKGRILVMDDEELILVLLSRILERAGYEVELSKDGEEAIRKYTAARDAGAPFAAVIMDLTIPGGMGGKEAINKLREIDPEVKVIVSSGYSTDPIMADYRTYGFSGVVAKPYHAGEVEKTLRDVLLD